MISVQGLNRWEGENHVVGGRTFPAEETRTKRNVLGVCEECEEATVVPEEESYRR